MQNKINKSEKVEIWWNSKVIKLLGQEKFEGVVIKNNKSDQEKEVKIDGLFYAIGHRPNSEIFDESVKFCR